MDKRIAIPAGLAIMVALAVIGVMSLFSFTATQPAEASITNISQGLQGNADLGKLTEPFASPLAATATVTGAGPVTTSPEDPGSPTRLTIPFTIGAAGALDGGTGEITILLNNDDWVVPPIMDRTRITITANSITNGGTTTASSAVNPQSVTVDFVGTESDLPEITLVIPDMLQGDSGNAIGNQGIDNNAIVRVVFSQDAGVKNPTEGGSYDIILSTSAETTPFTLVDEVFVPILLDLSDAKDARGRTITMVAKGVKNGTTVTFFRDENGDSARQSAERVLCRSVATSADIATCDYNIANPPFDPDRGNGNCAFASLGLAAFDCNYINVFDGEDNFLTQRNQTDLNNSIFNLEPTITASPNTANIGDKVVVSLFDYPGTSIVNATGVRLGGLAVTGANLSPQTPSIDNTTGQGNFTMTIPGSVPLGVQQLVVTDNTGGSQDITITIGGANLSLSHTQVIANQDLTISGNGFTQRGTGAIACILQGDVLFNSVPVVIDNDSLDADCNTVHSTPGVELSSGGTFTMTVILAQADDTIPSGLLTAGNHELKLTDTSGAEGTIDVVVPQRTIQVTPLSARPRDTVTIIGRNYISDNTDSGVTGRVEITYDCGADDQVETVDPDASGNFRETLRIPSGCTIPSTNTITAEIDDGSSGGTGVVDTLTHEIPDALVRVTPLRGPQGGRVTVTGEGFRTFETVESIEFGGRGSLGGRTVNTDAQGNFSVDDLLIPGLDAGVHSVIVKVGTDDDETTSSTSFEVVEEGFSGELTTPIEDALAPLFEDDTLDRAFFFNNATKEWSFYINEEAFMSANDLDDIPSGQPIWIKITEDTSVELNNQPFNLTCINANTPEEDCWNQIVFP